MAFSPRIKHCVAAFSTGLLYSLARGAGWGYFMLVPTVPPGINAKQQFDIVSILLSLSGWLPVDSLCSFEAHSTRNNLITATFSVQGEEYY